MTWSWSWPVALEWVKSLTPTLAVYVAYLAQRKPLSKVATKEKLEEVYVRVDGRLDTALSKIERLEREIDRLHDTIPKRGRAD